MLVQDNCFLASTGSMDQKQLSMKAGFGTEKLQMTRIAPRAYSQWETRRNANGRPATVFVHAPGLIMETNLRMNEGMHVYTSSIVALTEGVTLHPPSTNVTRYWEEKKKEVCLVQGPGTVYVSSSPISKQARRLLNATPPKSNLLSYILWVFCAWGCVLIMFFMFYYYQDLVGGRWTT